MKQHAIILGILALAFFCRVIGQLWVVLDSPGFLPPAEEWQSGLIPYSLLLPAQVCILIFQLVVFLQLWMQSGPLTTPRPSLGRFLKFSRCSVFYGNDCTLRTYDVFIPRHALARRYYSSFLSLCASSLHLCALATFSKDNSKNLNCSKAQDCISS